MRIAVLSGKGGAGKTFVSVNLAAAAGADYVDCDVEEPNGRIFLKPDNVSTEKVNVKIPVFNAERCSGCRRCVDFCRFNALVYLNDSPMVFSEVCHSCGGCRLVCRDGAITEADRPVGIVETGYSHGGRVITGVLNMGEVSSVPVIKAALNKAFAEETKDVIIDCPPGSACGVMESISDCDVCVLTAEPTAFGFHNFKMVYELASLSGKPVVVVINKEEQPYKPLLDFCSEKNIKIAMRIPYNKSFAGIIAEGRLLSDESISAKDKFSALYSIIKEEAER